MNEQTPPNDIDLSRHTQWAFPSPIIGYQWPDAQALNQALTATILQQERNHPGTASRSTIGGWHSEGDIFSWPGQAIEGLRQRIDRLVAPLMSSTFADRPNSRIDYRVHGWANVLHDSHYNTVHNHPGAIWSGVYYVAVGSPDATRPNCGDLEFIDPRAGVNMGSLPGNVLDRSVRLRPVDGFTVLFPAWLKHFVHPYFGAVPRISIAFNVTCSEIRAADEPAGVTNA